MKDKDKTLDKPEDNFSHLESELKRPQQMFTSLLDSLEAVIYVSDIKTNELLFLNKYARDIFGDVVGKLCWQSLQIGQTGPCDFCTNDKLLTPDGKPKGVYRWEFNNTVNGKWYDIHDRAIEWIDGRIARLEIATDITEKKKAIDALIARERELAESQRVAHIGSWDWDIASNSITWSTELFQRFGVSPQEFEATFEAFLSMVHPDDKEMLENEVKKSVENKTPYYIDVRIINPDGRKWVMEARGVVTCDESGNPIRMGGTAQDITERKKLEEKLNIIFESVNDAIFLLNKDGRFIDVNSTAYERLGYTKEEMLSMHISQLDPPEFSVRVPERIEAIKKHGKALFESAHLKKDGTIMPVEVNSTLITLDGKEMFLSSIRDITERKQLEETYNSLVNNTDDSIYLVDKNYKYTFINSSHLLRLGLSKDQYIEKAYNDFHSLKEAELFTEKAEKVFNSGKSHQYEYKSLRDDKYFLQTFSPVKDLNNETIAITIISKDITSLKNAEEKLYHLSMTDELTGLYNRRGFLSLSEQQLKLANRENKKMFLMSADLDFLKLINDLAGHKGGDLALIKTANILKDTFRESDIVARIGGDEFVVFGTDPPDTSIETLTDRLRKNLNANNAEANDPFSEISLSYAFVGYDPKHPCSIDELLSKADKLMYEEKRKNR